MQNRCGFTLVEMLVVITVSAVMAAVCTGILCMLLQAEHRGRDDLHHGMTAGRLAEQFRDDVHAAAGLPPNQPDRSGWQFQLPPDRTVDYRVARGTVVRTERVGGALRRQESYQLPEESHGRHRGFPGSAAGGGLFAVGPAGREPAPRRSGLRPRLPLCQDARQEGTMRKDRKARRGLSRFSRRGGRCCPNRWFRRENGTVPLRDRGPPASSAAGWS